MVVKSLSLWLIVCIWVPFTRKAAECRRRDVEEKDSTEASPGSITLEYLEAYYPIKEHVIPFLGSPEDSGYEELNGVEESPEEPEDSQVNENISNNLNHKFEPSYSFYAFVNTRQPIKSCSIDNEDFKVEVSRLARWGSGSDQYTPDLKEMIENNRNSNGVLLVDFFATWCGPCRRMNQNLEVIKDHYQSDKLTVYSIDVDQDKRYIDEYQINALPSLLLFARGNLHKKLVGLTDVQTLIQEIDKTLDTLI